MSVSDWLPLFGAAIAAIVALVAILGFTYKLHRDLRSDLLQEMARNRQEMEQSKQELLRQIDRHSHETGSDTGVVMYRGGSNR